MTLPFPLLPTQLLIDASRMVWRRWSGRLPTGIDRVCLAYLDHFGPRAQVVLQWRGRVRVLPPALSVRLLHLLARTGPGWGAREFRLAFARMIPKIALCGDGGSGIAGALYLNVGHTGLDDPALPHWIVRRGVKAIFLIHDLIPLTHPQFCRAGEDERHRLRMRHALEVAYGIIGNSAATLDDLAAFADRQRLPHPPALAAWISGHAPPPEARPARLDRPWFLTVGTIEGRKNHALLLQVWQRLALVLEDRTPLLVVVGQRGWEAELAQAMLDRDPLIAPHVIERARADDHELAALFTGARALLMPSFAEGFGLPVIEAMQLGTPVIASDLPVFREIAGDIPLYLDPTDGPAWLAAVSDFIDDSVERTRQQQAMRGYRAPGWAEHFERVETWLEAIGATRA